MSKLSRKPPSESLNDSIEDFAPSSITNLPPPVVKSKLSKPSKKTKKVPAKIPTPKEPFIDPNLELAVALSASLDPSKPDVLLPGASNWKPLSKKKNRLIKTPLELRSIQERNRLLADRVSSILDERVRHPFSSLYFPLPKGDIRNPRLVKALKSRHTSLWDLSTQKLRANSRFYVPHLLKTKASPKKNIAQEVNGSDPLSLLSSNYMTLVNEPRGSDITIYVKGDKSISAHSIIFHCRFPSLLKDIILEGKTQILSWPEVHFTPALAFLGYVYGAHLPQSLSTRSELSGLRVLAKTYKVKALSSYLNSIDERTLIDDNEYVEEDVNALEEDEDGISATQNLMHLIDALERENDDESADENEEIVQKHAKRDLDDIQDLILTQRILEPVVNPITCEDASVSEEPDSAAQMNAQGEEEIIDLTQGSPIGITSPDIFADEEDSLALPEDVILGRKRKSDYDGRVSKLSKYDQSALENSNFSSSSKEQVVQKLDIEDKELSDEEDLFYLPCPSRRKVDSDIEDDMFSLPTPSRNPVDSSSDVEILLSPQEGGKASPLPKGNSTQSMDQEEFHTPKSITFASGFPEDSFLVGMSHEKLPSPPRTHRKSVSLIKALSVVSSPKGATPMLDYDSMLTPALRAELKKFGLKAVPRSKACRLLKYIYDETHKTEKEEEEEEPLSSSQASHESSIEDMAEESIHFPRSESPTPEYSSSQKQPDDLSEKVKTFIRSNPTYWRQVLEYEPIWLEDFVSTFKSSANGFRKAKEAQILDIFDNECITFRSRKSQYRRGNNKNSTSSQVVPKGTP